MQIMNRLICIILFGGIFIDSARTQTAGLTYVSEWQYDLKKRLNYVGLLRLEGELTLGALSLELATLHIHNLSEERLMHDWQTFSNIEESNLAMGIAIAGISGRWGRHHVFGGIRNMNEDYFISEVTSFFTNSSCGIFPTISLNYPVANYPASAYCLNYNYQGIRWDYTCSLYSGVARTGVAGKECLFDRPFRDGGITGVSTINYHTEHGSYFYGVALHNRLLSDFQKREADDETIQEESVYKKKINFAWWLLAEQEVYRSGGRRITVLGQYSQNESVRRSVSVSQKEANEDIAVCCYRYGGVGILFDQFLPLKRPNRMGAFLNQALCNAGKETAMEVTAQFELTPNVQIQPAFHGVFKNGDFEKALMVRLIIEL